MAFGQNENGEYGFYWGKVVNNKDSEKLGRVQVTVPAVVDTPVWAWPVGQPGSGLEGHGTYMIPRLHSTVLVGFINGDIDEMFYMSGPHRSNGTPTAVSAEDVSSSDAPNIRAIETETFEIIIKDTADEKKLIIRSKFFASGGEIEIDAVDKTIAIRAETGLVLEAEGAVNINAPVVTVRNRMILTSSRPI